MARRPRSTAENPTISPQHVLSLLRQTVPPVHPAGLPFISAGLGLALLGRRSRWLRRAGLLAAGACAGFFRHPPRVPPTRPGVVVAPADGQVCLIESAAPPPELGMGDAELLRVYRRQVFEASSPPPPRVIQYDVAERRCGCCGQVNQGRTLGL